MVQTNSLTQEIISLEVDITLQSNLDKISNFFYFKIEREREREREREFIICNKLSNKIHLFLYLY